jgi:hypothetical protein
VGQAGEVGGVDRAGEGQLEAAVKEGPVGEVGGVDRAGEVAAEGGPAGAGQAEEVDAEETKENPAETMRQRANRAV